RYPTTSDDLYIFSRSVDNTTVYVFTNLGNKTKNITYKGKVPEGNATTVNFFTGQTEEFPVKLAPGEYYIYVNR
ncbi:hypothetical protein, partial [uncultured Muribaculum sp.]